jgi:CRP-like cAMP-binding protein
MEPALESVLSANGLLSHLSYFLLIISMLSHKMFWLRVGVIASALAGIAYALLVRGDPASAFWEFLLLTVNLFQIMRTVFAERRINFSTEENDMVINLFRDLRQTEARKLIDKGFWLDLKVDQELIREGAAVESLYYLSNGKADVRSSGKIVGHCGARDLIGEGTILTSDRATASVTLTEDSRGWCIPAPILRAHLDKNPTVRSVIDRRIADALKSKLRASNVAISRAGGLVD